VNRRDFVAAASVGLASCGRSEPLANSYAFVANSEGKAIAIIDLAVFTLAGRIPLAANPTEVIASPARRTIYALSAADGLLHEINVAKRQVTRRVAVGVGARGLRISSDQTMLCVATRQQVVLVGRQLFDVKARIHLPAPVMDFDVSLESPHATCSLASGEVAIIDLVSRSMVRRAKLSSAAGTLRFLKNGERILVGLPYERLLSVVDTATGQLVVDLPLAIRPDRFCFSGDLGQLFVTGEGADAVAIVYPFQSQVAATLLAGHQPGAMAASRNPAYLFVANPTSNAVTVLDVVSQRVVGAVPVGQQPGHIIVTPDDQFALVLNQSSGDMAVLATSRFAKVVRRDRSAPLFHLVPVGSAPVSAAIGMSST
jgi:YVTN family beta-propeller protein